MNIFLSYRYLILLTIATSFFYTPIKILFDLVFGIKIIPIFLPLLVTGVFLKLSSCQAKFLHEVKLSWFDIPMTVYFVSLIVSLVTTFSQLGNMNGVLNCMGQFFKLPIAYFSFRLLLLKTYNFNFIESFVLKLIKVAVVWILIEFIVVNTFDLSASIETVVNPILSSERIYDGIGLWVKASGPIPGPQNASIIASIALILFWRKLSRKYNKLNFIWVLFSILAFFFSFTLTGVVILILVQTLFNNRKNILHFLWTLLISGIFFIVGYFFIDQILSLKTGISTTEFNLKEYYLREIYNQSVGSFFTIISNNYLGVGFAQNISGADVDQLGMLGLDVPREIFLLRMFAFGGILLVFAMILIFLIALIQYQRLRLISEAKRTIAQSYFIVLASILFSTFHYPSFITSGFSILMAVVSAQLASHNIFSLRIINRIRR
jgi:hypothetical protein